jgi:hypothetical protein
MHSESVSAPVTRRVQGWPSVAFGEMGKVRQVACEVESESQKV